MRALTQYLTNKKLSLDKRLFIMRALTQYLTNKKLSLDKRLLSTVPGILIGSYSPQLCTSIKNFSTYLFFTIKITAFGVSCACPGCFLDWLASLNYRPIDWHHVIDTMVNFSKSHFGQHSSPKQWKIYFSTPL